MLATTDRREAAVTRRTPTQSSAFHQSPTAPTIGKPATGRRRRAGGGALAATLVVAVAIIVGWVLSSDEHLTPQHGLGYALGIAGGSAMLLLLVYPLRKRKPSLRFLGSTVFWFRIHMTLGILGPVLILFHSNFQLGSLNSNVALFTMLTVAISGLAGRYLYGKVHDVLDGRRLRVTEMLRDVEAWKRLVGGDGQIADGVLKTLTEFEAKIMRQQSSLLAALWHRFRLGGKLRRIRSQILKALQKLLADEARRQSWSWSQKRNKSTAIRLHLDGLLEAMKHAATFAFYERLFALWHVLHMPLFIMLVLSAVVHIIAVHLY